VSGEQGKVAEDDAAAAIDGDEPFSADEKTFLEIQGYRQDRDDPRAPCSAP